MSPPIATETAPSSNTEHAWQANPGGLQERRRDLVLQTFVETVLEPGEAREVLRGVYTEALHAVIQSRLTELRLVNPTVPAKVKPLLGWRLKRVYAFIDAHLSESISLGDLARTAGMSRMYFAAQFRAATGLRPHEYIVRRRISLAKRLMGTSRQALVEVALSVGFQTQSHFSTVFKRVEGTSPRRWRERQLHAEAIEATLENI